MSRQQHLQFQQLAELIGADLSNCLITFNSTNSTDGSAGGDERAGHKIDTQDFAYQQIVSNNVTVAALTLWTWEWLVALPAEIHLYRTRRWTSPQAVLLFLVRYGTLPSVLLSGYLTFNNFDKDQSCPQHTQLTVAIVQLIVSMTFGWRAIAIWRKDRRIVALVTFIVVAQFATSMTLLWYSDTVRLSNSTCMPVPSPDGFNSFPWFYLTAIIVDFLLMLISTFKLWQFAELDSPAAIRRREFSPHGSRSGTRMTGTSSTGSHPANSNLPRSRSSSHSVAQNISTFRLKCLSLTPLLGQLLKNGLLYFLAAAAFNIVNLSLELSQNLHAKAVLQLYAPLMSVLASRVILLEVKALYGSRHGGSRQKERNLVDQVIRANEGRESWEGDDHEEIRGTAAQTGKQDVNEKEVENAMSEGRSSESSPISNPKSNLSSASDPDPDHSGSNPHRVIQIPPTAQREAFQSPLIYNPPTLASEARRPSAVSFETSSNIKAVSKAFPHLHTSNETTSTPILPQVVEPHEKLIDPSTRPKDEEGWNLKNRFNSLRRSKRFSGLSSELATLEMNDAQATVPPSRNPSDHEFDANCLQIPNLTTNPEQANTIGHGEAPKSRKGSRTSSTNHRSTHSRKSSLASNRSFDPSQLSDANRALAIRMAGMSPTYQGSTSNSIEGGDGGGLNVEKEA